MFTLLGHMTEPVHNTVAHSLDHPVTIAVVAAVIVGSVVLIHRLARRGRRDRADR